MSNEPSWMADVVFDENGLIPAIAQDADNGQIMMVAWMNRESLAETAATGRAVYWSRICSPIILSSFPVMILFIAL